MSDDLDTRLRRSLESLTGDPSIAGVYEHVAAKRRRRRRVHLAQVATASVVGVLAVGFVTVSVVRDGSQSSVATRGASSVARVVAGVDVGRGPVATAGRAVRLAAVELGSEAGYVRGPLLATGRSVALAGYDRDGSGFTVPPSRVVRLRLPGVQAQDQVDLQGEILSLADGEGARWALTQDKTVLGPEDPEYRIKRIASDGAVVSNPVPPGSVPAGDIVAFGGGVWLPVRDGVLRFDPATGALADRIAFDTSTDRRSIAAFGKFAAVTDGTRLVRLDPAADVPGAGVLTITDDRLGHLDGVTGDRGISWLLGTHRGGGGDLVYLLRSLDSPPAAIRLPRDVDATGIQSANGVTWIDAMVSGHPAVLVLAASEARVERTIVLPAGTDVAFTFLAPSRALVAVDGRLRTIDL